MGSLLAAAAQSPASIIVSEAFANRWVATETVNAGPVRDFILGAEVYGQQQTRAVSQVRFSPHPSHARLALVLRGHVSNVTEGHTRQAVVTSTGSYQFELVKPIEFDGQQLITQSPAAFMQIDQRNRSVWTPVSHLPLVGHIADTITYRAAQQRQPIARMIAAQKLTREIGPRFNNEVDTELSKANQAWLPQLRSMLGKLPVANASLASRSTHGWLWVGLAPSPSRSPATTRFPTPPVGGATVTIRDDLVNAALEALPLAGLEVSDTDLMRIPELLSSAKGGLSDLTRLLSIEPRQPQSATLVLAGNQPVRVDFSGRSVTLELQCRIRPVVGPEIPPVRIVVEFEPRVAESVVAIEPVSANVSLLEPASAPLESLAQLAGTVIKQQIEQDLATAVIPRRLQLPGPNQSTEAVTLQQLRVDGGLLVLSYD